MASDWRQRHKEELRRRLYATAVELFSTQGYESTSVQQITEEVGVAKGTFFNHFPSKEHVIAEWYNAITFECLAEARDWVRTRREEGETATAEEAVCRIFEDMARRATSSPELLVAKSRHGGNPLLVEAEKTQDDEIDVFVLEMIQGGIERGELTADLDAAFFVDLLGAVLTGTSRAWVSSEPRFDFPAAIRARLRFVFLAARVDPP